MDLLDRRRLSQAQQVVAALQRAAMIGKLLAPKPRLVQRQGLDHRPHRAVEHQDPVAERPFQLQT